MYTTLKALAAALDPSGAVLTSWKGWQPCPPYNRNIAQNSSSPMYGSSWTGVACQDSPSSCSASTMVGGVTQLLLTGLGLNGTLPCALSGLSTLTSIDLSNNAIIGYIPSSLGMLSPMYSLTSLSTLSLNRNQLVGSLPWTFGAYPHGSSSGPVHSSALTIVTSMALQLRQACLFLHFRSRATRACVAFYRQVSRPITLPPIPVPPTSRGAPAWAQLARLMCHLWASHAARRCGHTQAATPMAQ